MNHQCEEAKLSTEEIAEIYRNMEARGLSHVFCQACSEEMKPEQATEELNRADHVPTVLHVQRHRRHAGGD